MLIYLVNFASGVLSPTKNSTATVNFINVTLSWPQELSQVKTVLRDLILSFFYVKTMYL